MGTRITQTVIVGGEGGAGAGGGGGGGWVTAAVIAGAAVLALGAAAAAIAAAVAALVALVKLLLMLLVCVLCVAGFAAVALLGYRFRRPIAAYIRWAVAPRPRQAVYTVQRDGLPWERVHQITDARPALPRQSGRQATPARR